MSAAQRAVERWDRAALLEDLAWSDDDVLAAAQRAESRWWCGEDRYPDRVPAYVVADVLCPVGVTRRWEFQRLIMPSLRGVLRRLRGMGEVDYTSVEALKRAWRAEPYVRSTGVPFWPGGGGLWAVTFLGDARLRWLDGELYDADGEPVPDWMEFADAYRAALA